MKHLLTPAALALSLSACGSGSTENGVPEDSSVETVDSVAGTTEAVAAVDGSVSSYDNPAIQPCLKAVAEKVGSDEVSLNKVEWSEAATGVYVNVAGADAPWLCTAWGDEVAGLSYTDDDGAF